MLYPMFALVLVTYVVMLINFVWRVKAVKSQSVPIKYFRVFSDMNAPEYIVAGKNHFSNLFETPLLFYVVVLLSIFYQFEAPWMVAVAWLYVIARVVHAIVHMTSNNILHRLSIFWFGMILLLLMWCGLVFQVYVTN